MVVSWWFRQQTEARLSAEPQGRRPWLILLGAPLVRGRPTLVLKARVRRAAHAWQQGAAEQLLITGDDGRFHSDETGWMRTALLAADVPEEALLVDGGARRTLESLRRARDRFAVESAYLVSQPDHLWRALVIADALGVRAHGLAAADAPTTTASQRIKRETRESAARLRALVDLRLLSRA